VPNPGRGQADVHDRGGQEHQWQDEELADADQGLLLAEQEGERVGERREDHRDQDGGQHGDEDAGRTAREPGPGEVSKPEDDQRLQYGRQRLVGERADHHGAAANR
jgi:hypothetical protein